MVVLGLDPTEEENPRRRRLLEEDANERPPAGLATARLLLLAVERGSVPDRGRALDEAERLLRNVLERNAGQAEARALVERLERLRSE